MDDHTAAGSVIRDSHNNLKMHTLTHSPSNSLPKDCFLSAQDRHTHTHTYTHTHTHSHPLTVPETSGGISCVCSYKRTASNLGVDRRLWIW